MMNSLDRFFKTELSFEKWHGARNDFLFVRLTDFVSSMSGPANPETVAEIAVELCHRNIGIGSDGLVVWEFDTSDGTTFAGIWNSDGSRAQTCGNALRCLASLLFSKKIWAGAEPLQIKEIVWSENVFVPGERSFAALLEAKQSNSFGEYTAAVEMGHVVEHRGGMLEAFRRCSSHIENQELLSKVVAVSFVQLANPHLVLQIAPGCFENLTLNEISEMGRFLQLQEICKQLNIPLSNIGVVEVSESPSSQPLNAVVYERGAGLTQCCGSGGCAMRVALNATRRKELTGTLALKMPGGVIEISEKENELILKGPAQLVAQLRTSSH
jgi:diaminopimelate epimerase